MMTFYHWTTKSALKSIQELGIVPRRGQHCKDIHDRTHGVVFLCKEEDINFWRNCFYDVEVLLSINIDEDFMHHNMKWRTSSLAPTGKEYASMCIIPPEWITNIQIIDREDFEGERQRYNSKYHLYV